MQDITEKSWSLAKGVCVFSAFCYKDRNKRQRMKIIFFISLFLSALLSCSGDCASCHFKLDYQNDPRHSQMLECKTCHTEEKMNSIEMGGCGQDCFACHSPQKLQNPSLSKEHGMIPQCIECHTSLQKKMFDPKNLFEGKSIFEQAPKLFPQK